MAYGIDPTALALTPSVALADERARQQLAVQKAIQGAQLDLQERSIKLAERRFALEERLALQPKESKFRPIEEELALKLAGRTEPRPLVEELAIRRAGKTERAPTTFEGKSEAKKNAFIGGLAGGAYVDAEGEVVDIKTQQEAFDAAVLSGLDPTDPDIRDAIMMLPSEEKDVSAWFDPRTWGKEPIPAPSPYGSKDTLGIR